jgi:hypothetical protein
MTKKTETRAAHRAHQDSQRILRTTAPLSLREATETITRQASDVTGADTPNEAHSVQDLTSRLLAKVDEAKRGRIDAVMRRAQTSAAVASAAASASGKKGPSAGVGPFRLDIRVEGGENSDEEELCIVPESVAANSSGVSPNSTSFFQRLSPLSGASGSQSTDMRPTAPDGVSQGANSADVDDADEIAKEKALVETIKRRQEIRRMNAHSLAMERAGSNSVSPTDAGRAFPPPPPNAPLLPGVSPLAVPRTALVSLVPGSLVSPSASVTIQRQKTASFTERLSAICKDGDAQRLARLNSYDNATSKTTVTFTSHR